MSDSVKQRVDRLIDEVINQHIDLFGLLMAERDVDPAEQRKRLGRLVTALRNRSVEKTIFEGGRRMATSFEDEGDNPRILFNAELLDRVDDSEIMIAMATPIAAVLKLSTLSVSLAFQARDERNLKNLTTKANRTVDTTPVKANEIPEYVTVKTTAFEERLRSVVTSLADRPLSFAVAGVEELRESLGSYRGWPDWIDVSDLAFSQAALTHAKTSLEGTSHADLAECIVELVWDSLGLSTQSFLRHAGRTLRSQNVEGLIDVLSALAGAMVPDDSDSTLAMEDWSGYAELSETWHKLVAREQAVFGNSPRVSVPPAVSLIEPAHESFGLEEPRELPWDLPLVCWTVREQNALKDLLMGMIKTLPGVDDEDFVSMSDLRKANEAALDVSGDKRSMGIQVVSIASDVVGQDSALLKRAWSSTLRHVLARFDQLDMAMREGAVQQLRVAYDELFPEAKPVWERRFHGLELADTRESFRRLVTEIHDLLQTPVIFDPFTTPGDAELSAYPTLAFVVGVGSSDGRFPFWLPLSALVSTTSGIPLRVRIVEVPTSSSEPCRWLSDRKLSLKKLQKQPAELLMRSIRGDALQMAIFE